MNNTLEIVLGNEQLEKIQAQVSSLILLEIEKAKRENSVFQRYMNKQETCKYLNISYNTLEKWMKNYELPHFKINGCCRFDKFAIDKWVGTL